MTALNNGRGNAPLAQLEPFSVRRFQKREHAVGNVLSFLRQENHLQRSPVAGDDQT